MMEKEDVLSYLASLETEQRKYTDADKRFWLNVSYIARKALSKEDNYEL